MHFGFGSHVDMLQRLGPFAFFVLHFTRILALDVFIALISNTFQAITFHRCKNLKVRNLMIVNSQKMHMQFTNCMRVVASHLQVIAPATSPNTDGIHISVSKGVQVKDSIIRTGDFPEKLLKYITLFSLLDPTHNFLFFIFNFEFLCTMLLPVMIALDV